MSDPLPPQQNPYAPPEASRISAEPDSERGGFWRDGKSVVLHRDARLPDRCLRCNEPAVQRLDRTLYWHHPALYLLILAGVLIYAIVALVVRKKLKTSFPLCAKHVNRRRTGIAMACGGALGIVALPMLSFSMGGGSGSASEMLGMLSIPAMLIVLVVGAFMATVAKATKIDDTYGWIAAGEPFLASCPVLPRPQ